MHTQTERRRARRVVVTPRDSELLVSLYQYRYLSLPQVERLHFRSTQTAVRRVRFLSESGYLSTFRAPGIPDRIAFLKEKGLALVAGSLGVPVAELGGIRSRTQPKDYYFLRHFLAATDFRITLTRACTDRTDVSLLGFLADHVVEQVGRGGIRRFIRDVAADIRAREATIRHTPDAVFALSHSDTAALFFLEIDRGTESVTDPERGFAKTLRFYLNYLAGGGYARYQEVFGVTKPFKAVRILVVTSAERRLENIRAAGAALHFEPATALAHVWLTESSRVTEATLSSSIWVSLDPNDAKTYRVFREQEQPVFSGEGALAHD